MEHLRKRYFDIIEELNKPFPAMFYHRRNKLLEEKERLERIFYDATHPKD